MYNICRIVERRKIARDSTHGFCYEEPLRFFCVANVSSIRGFYLDLKSNAEGIQSVSFLYVNTKQQYPESVTPTTFPYPKNTKCNRKEK